MHRKADRLAARGLKPAPVRISLASRLVATALAVAVGLVVAGGIGCAGAEPTDDEATGSREARPAPGDGRSEEEGGSLADSAAAAARQLDEAMARTHADAGDAGQRVEWVETWPRDGEQGAQGPDPAEAAADPGADADREADAEADAETEADESPGSDGKREAPAAPDREAVPAGPEELLSQLLGHVRNADEPTFRRALTAATLRAAVGDASLDPYLVGTLGYTQRRAVERYQRMLLAMLDRFGESDASLDRAALLDGIDALFEHEPVEIRKLALCREVSGYGSYEPFEHYRFLAGERQRVIVYVELDHFRPRQLGDGRYEVSLQQQVVLYNEADGLAVWRHDPVQITDVSRNRRRDFFIVQLITLPERLNVGNYRLKVRVTDEHGGSIDEITTRIQLLADENLLAEQDQADG